MSKFVSYYNKLKGRQNLEAWEMQEALHEILSGLVKEDQVISFLTALRDKGETIQEVLGAVEYLNSKSVKLPIKSRDVVDTCGTGGDQKNTFNISTAVAFVVAGAGIKVAKHGNAAVSSQSGSADVLKACGINIEASPKIVARCIDEIGIGFLFAPLFHPTLKAVSQARKKIGTKTIFNILGPLLNPAGAKRQVIGVYDRKLVTLVSAVLKETKMQKAAVVYGNDGLDELTLTTNSTISFVTNGKVKEEIFDPRSVGYPFCKPQDLVGGTPEQNALRMKKMLKGHSEPIDHCVHLNAALVMMIAADVSNFKEALLRVQESISSGKAYQKLEALIELSNS